MILRMKQERLRKKWTQEDVAKVIGISSEAVCLIETNQRNPSFNVLVKLLDLFGYTDPRQLFAVVDEEGTP